MKLIHAIVCALTFSSLAYRREITTNDLREKLQSRGVTPSKGQLRNALKKMRKAGILYHDPTVKMSFNFRSDFLAAGTKGTISLYLQYGKIPEHMYFRPSFAQAYAVIQG